MNPESRYWPAVGDEVWDRIRAEFGLPALEEVRERYVALHTDPEPVMRQLVRVFIGDDTFCPGFQFTGEGRLDPRVLTLFDKALELGVPHNVFAAWMVTPLAADAPRPVDALGRLDRLGRELEMFASGRPGASPRGS